MINPVIGVPVATGLLWPIYSIASIIPGLNATMSPQTTYARSHEYPGINVLGPAFNELKTLLLLREI